jgi:hypothetical protein
MPSARRIYWRDPGLWPSVRAFVPPGYRVATHRCEADRHAAATFAASSLTAHARDQYMALWETAMDTGYQSSGLLVACLNELASAIGHTSKTVPCRFGRFCREHRLWRYVPGKLYPSPRGLAPGHRARCYLILAPITQDIP